MDHLKQRQKEKVSMKLLERFEGPYEIIRKINPVLYDSCDKHEAILSTQCYRLAV